MSIAQQIATRAAPPRPRRPASPLHPVPARRRVHALVRIACLLSMTALGAALTVGMVAIGIMVVASNLGG
ncbi:MAG: hypothetical protein QOE62_1059 [Actinomycetota bacterium]|nr:hypothetical protein [Actinomycetota bacterium]